MILDCQKIFPHGFATKHAPFLKNLDSEIE